MDGAKSDRYVGMCTKCRGFLPPEVKYAVRRDLESNKEDHELNDPFDLGEYDDEGW